MKDDPRLTASAVERALKRLGESLEYHVDVEVLLVGGAAGMLTGVLPAARTTTDCDVMVYVPAQAMAAVEIAADRVADEMGLLRGWLNSDVQLRLDALPDGWEARRFMVGHWGRLRVWAAGRRDLIAMKVLAGRAQDLEDLRAMGVGGEDVAFVRGYLVRLEAKGTRREQVAEAMVLLRAIEVRE